MFGMAALRQERPFELWLSLTSGSQRNRKNIVDYLALARNSISPSRSILRAGEHNRRITILLAMAYGNAAITARSLKYRTTLASGAPRSMKMGNIRSPWRYEAGACHALRPPMPRRRAIVYYGARTTIFPISQGGPVTLWWWPRRSITGIDVVCQRQPSLTTPGKRSLASV
jgi:hypothetical protein